MQTGAITSHLDVAQVVFTTFVVFFLLLVRYLQRESNREGFPLRDHNNAVVAGEGLFGIPDPKTFILPRGLTVQAPRPEPEPVIGAHENVGFYPGAPVEPTGNKLLSNLGPAAYAERADVPDAQFFDGTPRIVPLRADAEYSVAVEGPDPRGFTVLGADRKAGGVVTDVWVDRTESMVRYYEVKTTGGRQVLLPSTNSDVDGDAETVIVELITGAQFEDVPATKNPDTVTLLEEDKITAYYAGGLLYATPARAEPLL